jgi:hypothetical protein
MATLSTNEKQILEKLFQMEGGYVLNFSDRSFAEFFRDDIGVNISDQQYAYISGSKANRLRRFWQVADDQMVGKSIDRLLDYVNGQIALNRLSEADFDQKLTRAARDIASRLSSPGANSRIESAQGSAVRSNIEVATNRTPPPDPLAQAEASENSVAGARKTWWKDPTVIVALLGLIGVLVTAYLQYAYKPDHSIEPVTVGFFVTQTGTTKPVKNAKVTLHLSTTHDERQTDNAGFARFVVHPEKDPAMQAAVTGDGYEDGSFNIETPKKDRNFDLYLDLKTAANTPVVQTPPQTNVPTATTPDQPPIVLFTFTNVTGEGIKCTNGRTEKRDANGGWVELIPTGKHCEQIVTIAYEELGDDRDWFYLWDTGRHMTARYPKKTGFVNWVLGKVYPNQAAATQWNVSQEVVRLN